jgi:hypothetical protein
VAVRRATTTNGRSPGPFVVAELTDSKHDELAVFAGGHETVARSALLGDAIAFAAVSPRARPIVAALQTPHGPTVRLIAAIDLGLVGEPTVAAIAAAARAHGLLAIGTRRRTATATDTDTDTDTDTPGGLRPQLQLHVHRAETVRLGANDEVAVIG